MSDADTRLRAAADRLDTYADDFHSREFAHRASQDRVTAALLRAVADEATVCQCRASYYRQPCQAHEEASETLAAALALADTILGVTDE